uniref:Uncharacterized protein n=1 Tax=Candidatus Methanophaga sp. ANME-1 ERB7 TaxID=2759913 RepID=A0A7G9ZCA3_9EURY|nr:hypothetical protein DNDHECJJ_00001 [Methanosarcinales archaeon ANME-1 ERB7]
MRRKDLPLMNSFFLKRKFYEVKVVEMWGMWGIYVEGGMRKVWAKDNESNAPEILS